MLSKISFPPSIHEYQSKRKSFVNTVKFLWKVDAGENYINCISVGMYLSVKRSNELNKIKVVYRIS